VTGRPIEPTRTAGFRRKIRTRNAVALYVTDPGVNRLTLFEGESTLFAGPF